MRLLHLKGCVAENRGDETMVVSMFFQWKGKFEFSRPERVIEVSFKDKLITSSKGYGFSFLAGQLVITDDETDIIMPPFGRPYLANTSNAESRAVFGMDATHEGWITGKGAKRPSETAGFDMQTINRMFRDVP